MCATLTPLHLLLLLQAVEVDAKPFIDCFAHADASLCLTYCVLLVQALAQAQQFAAQAAAESKGKIRTSFQQTPHTIAATHVHVGTRPTTIQTLGDSRHAQLYCFPRDTSTDQHTVMTAVGVGAQSLPGQVPRPIGVIDQGQMHVGHGNNAQTPAGSADKEQRARAVFNRGGDAHDGDSDSEADEEAGAEQAAKCSQANGMNAIDEIAHQMENLGRVSHESAIGNCDETAKPQEQASSRSRRVPGAHKSREQALRRAQSGAEAASELEALLADAGIVEAKAPAASKRPSRKHAAASRLLCHASVMKGQANNRKSKPSCSKPR